MASLQAASSFSMNDMMVQGIMQALEDYLAQPDNPQWTREARDMDAEIQVTRPVALRRYIIDQAHSRPLSVEHQAHWEKLVKETGKEVFERLAQLWSEKFPSVSLHTAPIPFAIQETLRQVRWEFAYTSVHD